MFSNNLISKTLNGRLFIPHNYFYIPLAGVKTKNAIELPEKPKKPLGSFFRFIRDQKAVLLRDNPELKVTAIVKKCAEDWRNIPPTIKERYDNEYKAEMEGFAKKHLDYSMKLTDEQREYIKQLNREKIDGTKKRKFKKKLRDLHKPKKPASAFLLYIIDQSNLKGQKITEVMKDMKGAWYLLDESERNQYFEKAKQLMEKYKEDLEKWETQMIQEGHTDLVRSGVLDEKRPATAKKEAVSKKKKPTEKTIKNE